MCITRYYISQFDPVYKEKFWSGERFTRLIDDCKVYTDKCSAKNKLTKLVNSGAYKGIQIKESRYSI